MRWLQKKPSIVSCQGVIVIAGKQIAYRMKTHQQARRMKLAVSSSKTIRITLPPKTSQEKGMRFIQDQQVWISQAFSRREARPHIILPNDAPSATYYRTARAIVLEKIEYFNAYYQFPHTAVRIKDIRTKWGSCSAKGNLNFSYKLQFLPTHLIDYIVVHELCHLKELNHGRGFWELVMQCIPDAPIRKKELRSIHVS